VLFVGSLSQTITKKKKHSVICNHGWLWERTSTLYM
jgi:hypothetical protein